ncbi:MAG: flavodoxin family protein [Candidatus Saccharibacteria bacterium]
MKITLLNGNPHPSSFDEYLDRIVQPVEAGGHKIKRYDLRERDIKYCTGCFGCWIKSPGVCQIQDDSVEILRKVIKSDLVLLASPIIMGFPSALLKNMIERLIPLIHPYFEIVQGEVHHIKRYPDYPVIGFLLERSEDTDDEDIRIIRDIALRNAINFKTRLGLFELTTRSAEEVAYAISRI